MMAQTTLQPGFRFHPTDDELISYYLKRKVMGKSFQIEVMSEIDVYKFAPWDLPAKSPLKSRDLEWFFFCPRGRKYGKSSRRSRCNDTGYWKTTGNDRPILHNNHPVGMRKTLVFYRGKAPRGDRTDWVLYEYRLEDQKFENTEYLQDAYTICKIFKKSGPGPKNGAQYGAPFCEEEWEDDDGHDLACSSFCASSRELSNGHIIHQPLVSGGGEMPSLPELPETDGTISDAEFLGSVSLPSAVGIESSLPEPPDVDGISLDLLAEYLNMSPCHPDIEIEMSHSVIPSANGDGLTEGILELDDLSGQAEPSIMDGIFLSDIMEINWPADALMCRAADKAYPQPAVAAAFPQQQAEAPQPYYTAATFPQQQAEAPQPYYTAAAFPQQQAEAPQPYYPAAAFPQQQAEASQPFYPAAAFPQQQAEASQPFYPAAAFPRQQAEAPQPYYTAAAFPQQQTEAPQPYYTAAAFPQQQAEAPQPYYTGRY